MVNGPKFRSLQKTFDKKKPIDVPYFMKLSDDANVIPGRNAIIKDPLFYKVLIGNETKTICLRLSESDDSKVTCNTGINVSNILSKHDTWLHQNKHFKDGIKEIFDIF